MVAGDGQGVDDALGLPGQTVQHAAERIPRAQFFDCLAHMGGLGGTEIRLPEERFKPPLLRSARPAKKLQVEQGLLALADVGTDGLPRLLLRAEHAQVIVADLEDDPQPLPE